MTDTSDQDDRDADHDDADADRDDADRGDGDDDDGDSGDHDSGDHDSGDHDSGDHDSGDDAPTQERLDALGERTQRAKVQADDAVMGYEAEPDKKFAESGSEGEDE